MKVAVCVFQNRVSPRLDRAKEVRIFDLADGRGPAPVEILAWEEETIRQRALSLCQRGVEVLVCGAVEPWAEQAVRDLGLKPVTWIQGEVEPLLDQIRQSGLESLKPAFRSDPPPGRPPF